MTPMVCGSTNSQYPTYTKYYSSTCCTEQRALPLLGPAFHVYAPAMTYVPSDSPVKGTPRGWVWKGVVFLVCSALLLLFAYNGQVRLYFQAFARLHTGLIGRCRSPCLAGPSSTV